MIATRPTNGVPCVKGIAPGMQSRRGRVDHACARLQICRAGKTVRRTLRRECFLLFLVHTRHATPPRAIVFTTIPHTNLAAKATRLASAPRMTVTIAACAILSALFLLPTRANVQSSLCII